MKTEWEKWIAALAVMLVSISPAWAEDRQPLQLQGESAFGFILETVDRSMPSLGLGKTAMVFGEGEAARVGDSVFWEFRFRRALLEGRPQTDAKPLAIVRLTTDSRGRPRQAEYRIRGKDVAGLSPDAPAYNVLGLMGEALMNGLYELPGGEVGEGDTMAQMGDFLARAAGTLLRLGALPAASLPAKADAYVNRGGRSALKGSFKGEWRLALGDTRISLFPEGELVLDRQTGLPHELAFRIASGSGDVDFRYRLSLQFRASAAPLAQNR